MSNHESSNKNGHWAWQSKILRAWQSKIPHLWSIHEFTICRLRLPEGNTQELHSDHFRLKLNVVKEVFSRKKWAKKMAPTTSIPYLLGCGDWIHRISSVQAKAAANWWSEIEGSCLQENGRDTWLPDEANGVQSCCDGLSCLIGPWLVDKTHGLHLKSQLKGSPTHSSVLEKMVVSYNGGTPKSSILMACSLINRPFWGTPIYGNPQMRNTWKQNGMQSMEPKKMANLNGKNSVAI